MSRAGLWLGLLFLYAPVLLLVGYSFSGGPTPFEWGGFSLRWFRVLWADDRLIEAAWLSLRIAAGAATLGTMLGTLAGTALARLGRFRGRALFGGLLGAPLVLPDIVTGLSLLLLFVTAQGALFALTGWAPDRGAGTVLLAHATLGGAYAAVVVQGRLAGLDRSLEEAAADLGAGAVTAFRTVTLPLLLPALVSAWLLAFTLSLDDVVVASFVSGPAATTLPMVLFSSLRLGLTPEVNALAATIVLGLSAAFGMAALLLHRTGRRTARVEGGEGRV